MTSGEFVAKLRQVEGVTMADAAGMDALQRLATHINLPPAHVDLLRIANGALAYGGFFRLFGCSSSATVDMVDWNAPETWTFAWNKPLQDFWFFGETAWGDQYAYRREDLRHSATPSVYFLEGITMDAEVISEDFNSFLENEFLRNAIQPYDENLVAARRRLGALGPLQHVAYVPSPLITGEENVESVTKLDAVASMIIGGDLCNQLAQESQEREIKELQPYQDANGRMRMRVVWS